MRRSRRWLFAGAAAALLGWGACKPEGLTAPDISAILITPARQTIYISDTVQLTAEVLDLSDHDLDIDVTWSSSSDSIAAVSATGLVTGIAAGTATIEAGAVGASGTASITVRAPVASVEVAPPADTLRAGTTVQLGTTLRDASGNPLDARPVTWSSDDVGVATVGSTGVVTGAGPGTTAITATSEGESDLADVTVFVGVTGSWSGSVELTFVTCSLAFSITEGAGGEVTGIGRLGSPCADIAYTVSGTNGAGGVADSVMLAFSSGGGTDFVFDGTAEGYDAGSGMMAGVINGGICTDCPASFDRTSIAPDP